MSFEIDVQRAIEVERKLRELMTKADIVLQIVEGFASEIDDITVKHAFAHALIREILRVLRFTPFELYGLVEAIKFEEFHELQEQRKDLEEQIRKGKYKQ
jgi:glucose-6-phosphate isomerase